MKPTSFIVNITSEEPDRVKAFYRDVLELPPNPEIGDGAFDLLPGLTLAIDGHSETKGKAKEPHRVLIDFFVDDLAAEQTRLKSKGVKFIRRRRYGVLGRRHLDLPRPRRQLLPARPVQAGVATRGEQSANGDLASVR